MSSNTDSPSKATNNNRRRLALGALAVVVLAAIIATVCAVTLRPETIPVIETEAEESLPSLLQVAPIEEASQGDGAILIEHTSLLEDASVVRFYVNVQDLDLAAHPGVTNPDNVALYLTRSSDVQAEDLPTMENNKLRRRKLEKMVTTDDEASDAFRIGFVNSVEFPFRLPETFAQGDFVGALLVEEFPNELSIISRVSFVDVAVVPAITDTNNTVEMNDKPAVEMAEEMMNKKPETEMAEETMNKPDDSPTTTTDMDMDTPMVPSMETAPAAAPLVLTSDLEGKYNLDQVSITIDTVSRFQNGAVVDAARLVFEIPKLADAPGPYLYLSKRPFSQTRNADIDNAQDLFVPIESGTDGQFNVQGNFEQFLDDLDAADLEEYVGGSWIVWCRPFGVWLGGGEIAAASA